MGKAKKSTRLERHASQRAGRINLKPYQRKKNDLVDEGKATRSLRNRATSVPAPRYMVAPEWGAHSERTGGTSMVVTIGPRQGDTGQYGSVPAANTPSVMRTLLDKHGEYGWVAGHLLNDNLGGPGIAQNLTPLTTAGNKNHLNTCETLIKNTIAASHRRMEFYKSDAYWYGVFYKVVVSNSVTEKWGTEYPWSAVATQLHVWAHCVKMSKETGVITHLDSAEAPAPDLWFAAMADVIVDNSGYA